MKKYDAVIAGYTCVDLVPAFKKGEKFNSITDVFKPGKLIEIDGLDFMLGGIVANTGLAMKKFGKKVFLNGLVGDDFMGIIVKESLKKCEVLDGLATTNQASTAFGIVLAPAGIDRFFLESPGCNQIFDIEHINFDAVAQSRLFHFGYPPLLERFYLNEGTLLAEMFDKVQKLGVLTSLDFSLPDSESESGKVNWLAVMQKVLPFTDIFVPSIEEAMQILMPAKYAEIQSIENYKFPLEVIKEVGRKAVELGAKIVLIKAGEQGAYLTTGDGASLNNSNCVYLSKNWCDCDIWCDAFLADETRIINANGAGDTAIAAFLTAILNGEEPANALKYATIAGRNNLYCHDIYSEIADWSDMTKEILEK